MQREGFGRILFIAGLTLLCLVLIFPTVRYFSKVAFGVFPDDPEELEVYQERLDKLRLKSINLGLDLQGGVDVLLEVDPGSATKDRIREYRTRLRDVFRIERLNAVLDITPDEKGIAVTLENPEDQRAANNILIDDYEDVFLPWDIDDLVQGNLVLRFQPDVIQYHVEESIDSALKVIRRRVDELGVTQPVVARQGGNRIRVQVPGEKDPERLIDNVVKPALLEFRIVHETNESKVAEIFNRIEELNPKTGKEDVRWELKPGKSLPPGWIGVPGETTDSDPDHPEISIIEKRFYLVKDKPELTGARLRNAYVEIDQMQLGSPINVGLEFDKEGTRLFAETTKNYVNWQLAIVLDGYIYSAPNITEPILGGRAVITGSFTADEARELSLVLKAGALPAVMKVEEKRTVGPTLGTESIRSSVKALLFATSLIAVFMVLYYGMAGAIALVALVLNVLMILAALSMMRATLTLSGIGGIILTIGMAVDANVLIYERIREELARGKPLRTAINNGFDRVFAVIWDSNLTTLLTALVLLQFGEGSVSGFALTMTFGLLANLYTALTVTKTLCGLWFKWRGRLNTGRLRIFAEPKLKFMNMRHSSFVLSGCLILITVGFLVHNRGPHFAVDLSGGVLSDVQFEREVSSEDVRAALIDAGLSAANVQEVPGKDEFLIRNLLINDSVDDTQTAIEGALSGAFAEDDFTILGTQAVGKSIGQEFSTIALTIIIGASVCILAYLWFRFEFIFGIAAVVALVHDLLITLGLVTILGVAISLDIVSAFLILLGYSVNDTIVIFDRIRENMRQSPGRDFKETTDLSINQSLNRTVITTGTSLLVMSSMYFLGGKSLNPFALTLLIGFIFGTYSSSFIAAPIVFNWRSRQKPQKQEAKTKGKGRRNARAAG